MNTQQYSAVSGGFIKTPNVPASLQKFWFEMKDYNGNELNEVELDGDVYISLHYDDSNVISQGWSESSLAVYYWKEASGEWIRLGGTVDTVSNNIVIRSSYLRKNYAILGEANVTGDVTGFIKVTAEPRMFTPGSSDNAFANVKISASFDTVTDSYNVKIFTLAGIMIKNYDRTEGAYSQGEVFWDGNDSEGYAVKSGVYIYRVVTAEGHSYTGTIVVVK